MTPKRLLRLWRERWGKGSENAPDRPYARGAVHAWMHRLAQSQFWSWPPLSAVLITLSALFVFFAVQIEFSLNGQISLGAIWVGMALFARRFAGHLFTMVLINLGGVAAISYFHWRLSKTLVFRNRTELLLSLSLCVLEIAWALYTVIRAGNLLWPLWRTTRHRSAKDQPWPTIDIVTSVNTLDERQALAHLEHLAALAMANEGRRLYIIDRRKRAGIAQFAERTGAIVIAVSPVSSQSVDTVVVRQGRCTSLRSDADDALACGQGEFVLLASPWALPTADLLEQSIDWFVAQPELSYLYSADHELAPRQFADLMPARGDDGTAGCSLLRRAAWLNARAQLRYDPTQPTRGLLAGSALLLPNASRLRFAPPAPQSATDESAAAVDLPLLVALPVMVERADSRAIMLLKRTLTHLQTLLRFYSPVPRAMLLLLPAIVLSGDFRLINFRMDFALAFAVPYLALLAMIDDRSDPIRRWGWLRAVRELVLAIYVPTLMAAAFVRASLSDPVLFLRRSFGSPRLVLFPTRSFTCYALVLLNGAALCHGIVQMFAHGAAHGWGLRADSLLFCALAAANLVVLLARQAIAHEARHIVSYLRSKERLSATLTFASGHTLSCRTNNFPSHELEIDLPCVLTTRDPGPWNLQLRYENRPVNLMVHASDPRGRRIVVRIDERSAPDFMRLRDHVLSRDWDWPSWLAHQNADRILPPWLHERLSKLPIWFIDASTKLAGALRFDQLYLLFKK